MLLLFLMSLNTSPFRDIAVVVGGVIPPQDYDQLYKAGAAEIFGPGNIVFTSPGENNFMIVESLIFTS